MIVSEDSFKRIRHAQLGSEFRLCDLGVHKVSEENDRLQPMRFYQLEARPLKLRKWPPLRSAALMVDPLALDVEHFSSSSSLDEALFLSSTEEEIPYEQIAPRTKDARSSKLSGAERKERHQRRVERRIEAVAARHEQRNIEAMRAFAEASGKHSHMGVVRRRQRAAAMNIVVHSPSEVLLSDDAGFEEMSWDSRSEVRLAPLSFVCCVVWFAFLSLRCARV